MKTKLIKLSEIHYIIVDDSEIKKGWVTNGVECFLRESMPEYSNEYANRYWKNITHSTEPLEGHDYLWRPLVKPLSLSEVEELINGYSVEKMSEEEFPLLDTSWCRTGAEEEENLQLLGHRHTFIKGFKAHQELVKDKLFTVEQVKKYHNIMCLHGNIKGEEYLQSLLPKTEWDIEFDENNKLKLI